MPDLAHGDVLTPEQVRTLSRDARVTIGAHTVSHPVLRSLTEAGSRRIVSSKARLETLTAQPVRHFAYPFGNRAAFGAREERLAREAGYAATTTRARPIVRPTVRRRCRASCSPASAIRSLRYPILLTGWFG